MKKTFSFWLLGLLLVMGQVYGQGRTVSGTVTDATTGEPLIGVNVVIKGTTQGTATDMDGNYTLDVPNATDILVFSYVGYATIERAADASVINISLAEGEVLKEVVITAVGLEREARSTSFANNTLNAAELNQTSANIFNSLQSKSPGVRINTTSGQMGASSRVVIRGESSLTGNNNALIVVDGIPINNSGNSNDNFVNKYSDFGNRANDIDPNNIASMNVLSGASAIALYGSRGANGVIVITTKTGKDLTDKKFKVGINSATTFDKAYILLQRQDQYGQGYYPAGIVPGENFSWGPALDGQVRPWTAPIETAQGTSQLIREYSAIPNQLQQFFNTGVTTDNGINISGNADKFAYYLAYSNTNSNGILPYSYYKRNSINFNASADLSEKLTTKFGIQYASVNMDAKLAGREFTNPYMSAIQTPVNIPISELRDFNSPYHGFEGYFGSYAPNPFYILNATKNVSKSHNVLGRFEVTYKPIKDLAITARVGDNIIFEEVDSREPKYNYTTDAFNPDNVGGPRSGSVGAYSLQNTVRNELNMDAFASYNKSFEKEISLSVTGGVSFFDNNAKSQSSNTNGGLVVPDFYQLSNSKEQASTSNDALRNRLLGIFANANIGYKRMIYIDYSARNDWSSTLPTNNNSFFYQAAGVSFIPTELFEKNKWLNYAKVRANIGTSGKDAAPYRINSTFASNPSFDDYSTPEYATRFPVVGIDGSAVPGYTLNNRIGNPDLKPELTTTWEIGGDVEFFNSKLNVNYTYYNRNSKNLIVDVSLPSTSGYTTVTKNVGQMTNKGHELNITATPVNVSGFRWDVRLNMNKNNNKVVKVSDEAKELSIGGSVDAQILAVEGQPFGVFKVYDYQTATVFDANKGDSVVKTIVNSQGYPLQATTLNYSGSLQPKYRMGFGTTLSYKGLRFDIQFDLNKGGQFFAGTKELAEFNGTTLTTLQNDRLPYLYPNSVVDNGDGTYSENDVAMIDPYPFFRDLPSKYMLVDASFLKLRDISLSYSLPKKLFKNTPISNISIALVGQNLKFWLPAQNQFADPEANADNGSGSSYAGNAQGFESSNTPPARRFGFRVNVDF